MNNIKNAMIIISISFITIFAKAQNNEPITLGEKITIHSKVLNESRKIWVYIPNNTALDKSILKKYPVLYVLDGDAHFYSTVGIIQQLSQANGNGFLPEMIVVAIENTNRLKDLTPAVKSSNATYEPNAFVTFLSKELMPFIETNYAASPYKLIIGHSLGGLTVIDLLTNFPNLFNAYIAVDPSMWLKNEAYLKNTLTQLQNTNFKSKKLFVGIANTMPKTMNLSKARADKSNETQHIRSILKLDNFLKSNNVGVQYNQKYYANETHNSLPLLSTYDGLRFIFNYFPFDASEKDFTDTTSLIANKLKNHYIKVSSELGYKVAAPESFINYLGYDALSKKNFEKSKALFEMNIDNYPSSSNAYIALGDYFTSKHDTTNAINNYTRAYAIKKDVLIENKLNALSTKNKFSLSVQELEKYVGTYSLDMYKINIILKIKNNTLWAVVPGQNDDELVPISKDVFTVKGKQGYTITFEIKANKPVSFISVQPNGTFKAIYINE